LLKLIKSTFGGIGNITSQQQDMYMWRVGSLHDLTNVIIPHFDSYPLRTQKKADFELFKRIVELMNRQEHFTLEGLQQIVNLRASMNNGLSEMLKDAFPNTNNVVRPITSLSEIQDGNWLTGFIDGVKEISWLWY
jgi:hypothetical protein